MSISKVSLVNGALIEIGASLIVSLSDDTDPARIANARFDDLLEQELTAHDWTFARARAQLGAESTTPAFEYTYSHILPASPYCLHVLGEYNDYDYVIEGRKILSDSTPLQITYTYRITDYNELSAPFRKAFIYKLAALLANPVKSSAKLKADMETLYNDAISLAKTRDSQQGSPKKATEDKDLEWLNARHMSI